jgi:WD40 repeat protein
MVCSFTCHEGGASSLVYSARHQLLITGGKKGDIGMILSNIISSTSLVIFDIRQQKILDTFKAHNMNVKSLAVDPQEDFIISGSSEGNVKLWDLPTLKNRECWEGVHSKQTFVRKPGVFAAPVSTFGVMQVALDYKYMYTCGSDGRLLRTAFHKNMSQSL